MRVAASSQALPETWAIPKLSAIVESDCFYSDALIYCMTGACPTHATKATNMIPSTNARIPIYATYDVCIFQLTKVRVAIQKNQIRASRYKEKLAAYEERRVAFSRDEADLQLHKERFAEQKGATHENWKVLHQAIVRIGQLKGKLVDDCQVLKAEWEELERNYAQLCEREHELLVKARVITAVTDHVRGPVYRRLIRHKHHCYAQDDYIVGSGQCSAISIEFVHWRRAGLDARAALDKLRSPSARHRLIETQRALERGYFRNMTAAPPSQPQPRSTAIYVKVYAEHFELMKRGAWPSGKPAEGFAGGTASELILCASVVPGFSFEMLTDIWPSWVFRPWQALELAVAKTEFEMDGGFAPKTLPPPPSSAAGASFQPLAPASLSGITGDTKAPARPKPPDRKTELPRAAAQMDPHQALIQEYLRWQAQIRAAFDKMLPAHENSGFVLCFIAIPDSWGHFIIIDLDKDEPGIFEPNTGFLALRSNDYSDPFFLWLLALLVFDYDVQRLDFMFAPRGTSATREPAAGLKLERKSLSR